MIKVILLCYEFIINPITKMSLTYLYGRLPINVGLEVIYVSVSILKYRKIPVISPGLIQLRKGF